MISVVMDFAVGRPSHRATLAALDHAAAADVDVDVAVLSTDEIDEPFLFGLAQPRQAVVIGPGTPYLTPRAPTQ